MTQRFNDAKVQWRKSFNQWRKGEAKNTQKLILGWGFNFDGIWISLDIIIAGQMKVCWVSFVMSIAFSEDSIHLIG